MKICHISKAAMPLIGLPLASRSSCGYNPKIMGDNSRYQETLNYLYSFVDYSLTHSDRYSPENFDLGRMRAFVDRLGNPQSRYPIIHIAGTKGKGSVAELPAIKPVYIPRLTWKIILSASR
jgi:hypothetical protein